jgi:hypothetical protein
MMRFAISSTTHNLGGNPLEARLRMYSIRTLSSRLVPIKED